MHGEERLDVGCTDAAASIAGKLVDGRARSNGVREYTRTWKVSPTLSVLSPSAIDFVMMGMMMCVVGK